MDGYEIVKHILDVSEDGIEFFDFNGFRASKLDPGLEAKVGIEVVEGGGGGGGLGWIVAVTRGCHVEAAFGADGRVGHVSACQGVQGRGMFMFQVVVRFAVRGGGGEGGHGGVGSLGWRWRAAVDGKGVRRFGLGALYVHGSWDGDARSEIAFVLDGAVVRLVGGEIGSLEIIACDRLVGWLVDGTGFAHIRVALALCRRVLLGSSLTDQACSEGELSLVTFQGRRGGAVVVREAVVVAQGTSHGEAVGWVEGGAGRRGFHQFILDVELWG